MNAVSAKSSNIDTEKFDSFRKSIDEDKRHVSHCE